MPIRFRCQDCRSRVKVPEGAQGKPVKCPRCGRIQSAPRHTQHHADHEADGLTVHTLVGSMHKAPKRREALVGAGASGGGFAGGGVPGGLDLPDLSGREDFSEVQKNRMSRKQRRKLAARARAAEREREAAQEEAAQEEAAQEEVASEASIAESRRRVEDLFATSHGKHKHAEDGAGDGPGRPDRPAGIALHGHGEARGDTFADEAARVGQTQPAGAGHGPDEAEPSGWSLDLSGQAYPFLKIIPWVLRVTALMLIGPAFKVMLVAGERGFSSVVCLLILFAGLALVVVTWTVGEIATAVRDIAVRKAAAQT